MDSLGGSSKALMFACCSPAGSYLEETLNTLQYAARTRNITNKPAVQVDPHEELVRELRKEMKLLKTQNAQLHYALQRCAQVDGVPDMVGAVIEEGLAAIGSQDELPLADDGYQDSPDGGGQRGGGGGGGGGGGASGTDCSPSGRAVSPETRGRRATGRRRAGAGGEPVVQRGRPRSRGSDDSGGYAGKPIPSSCTDR